MLKIRFRDRVECALDFAACFTTKRSALGTSHRLRSAFYQPIHREHSERISAIGMHGQTDLVDLRTMNCTSRDFVFLVDTIGKRSFKFAPWLCLLCAFFIFSRDGRGSGDYRVGSESTASVHLES